MYKNVLFKNSTGIFIVVIFTIISAGLKAQNVTITDGDAYNAHISAMLDVKSTIKGLLIPRLTTSNRNSLTAITVEGLLVYDTDESAFYYFTGGVWNNLSKGQLCLKRLQKLEEILTSK